MAKEPKPSEDSIGYTLLENQDTDSNKIIHETSNLVNVENSEEIEEESDPEHKLTSTCETFWNICNTIQGLPILAIPYAVKNGGFLALMVMFIIAVTSNYTAQIIVRCLYDKGICADKSKRKRIRNSFVEIGQAFNSRFGGSLVLVTEILQLLFLSAVYPRMVGRMLANSFPNVVSIPCWLWTMIGGIAFVPNIFLQNLSQVAWTSIITVVSAKVIFVVVFTYSVSQYQRWELASLGNFDIHTFPAALGVLVASYLSQPFVPIIEGSMRNKKKFNLVMNLAYSSMTLLNVVIGFVAFISFQPNTAEVITNNLPEGSFRRVINIMAALLAFTSYTLPMFTIFDIVQTQSQLPFLRENFGAKVCCPDVLVFRTILVSCSVLMAAVIPRFAYLLALVGSIAGISMEFIFPPLFHSKLYFNELHWWELLVNILIISIGTFFMLTGVFFSGKSLFLLN
ncbi:vesicular inhibitory amino acid transporter-like [Actinia tenebrosa]|uniref:Vesicular inhibitory amino acid transporter-like n=1 Tax=Actinia tenebrosa TaxID=6105 RepID=A0A6P8IH95_ACTTE|nr:vesicular inhibitory amino acid transporter-like [Actinia tenebrosa]XP_031566094.1 vesicular inhibitory amino acid transporter-like [Actinia tenebrosa]